MILGTSGPVLNLCTIYEAVVIFIFGLQLSAGIFLNFFADPIKMFPRAILLKVNHVPKGKPNAHAINTLHLPRREIQSHC